MIVLTMLGEGSQSLYNALYFHADPKIIIASDESLVLALHGHTLHLASHRFK
jgi:hypothetical protein